MKDHQVRNQVVVPDNLALLFTVVLANDPVATKGDPLDKAVPRLDGIGCRIDSAPHLFVVIKVEEEDGAYNTAKFTKGRVEFVLIAVGSELAKNRR